MTSHDETPLTARLAKRWKLLQALGVALIAASTVMSWTKPDDTRLPPDGPFVLLIGVILFITGSMMAWWRRD